MPASAAEKGLERAPPTLPPPTPDPAEWTMTPPRTTPPGPSGAEPPIQPRRSATTPHDSPPGLRARRRRFPSAGLSRVTKFSANHLFFARRRASMRRGGRPSGSGTRRRARPEGGGALFFEGRPFQEPPGGSPTLSRRVTGARTRRNPRPGRPVASARRPGLSDDRPYCTRRRPEALLLAAADVHRATARAEGAVRPAPCRRRAPPRPAARALLRACHSAACTAGVRERAPGPRTVASGGARADCRARAWCPAACPRLSQTASLSCSPSAPDRPPSRPRCYYVPGPGIPVAPYATYYTCR